MSSTLQPLFPSRRLPSSHPSLIRWSAPLCVRIRLLSLGLSLGRQHVESFTPCMTSELRRLLSGPSAARRVAGLEASINCGGLQVGPGSYPLAGGAPVGGT